MVFFAFSGTADEMRSTGIGAYSGGRWKAIPSGSCLIGILYNGDHNDRRDIESLHQNIVTLPGPHGKLAKKHISKIGRDFPNVKEGDAFSAVLSTIYQKTGDEDFNPDNH